MCLVTVTDNNYLQGTLVMLYTFLKYNKWFGGEIVILHDNNLTNTTRDTLSLFDNLFFVEIDPILANGVETLIKEYPQYEKKYRRFFSIEIFKLNDYDKILFLDSDTLIKNDISTIFFSGTDILACHDVSYYLNKVRDSKTFECINKESKHLCIEHSFNTGVMLIGKKYINKEVYDDLVQMIYNTRWNLLITPHTDQYILSHYFNNCIQFMDIKYNLLSPHYELIYQKEKIDIDAAAILHFVGRGKPWQHKEILDRVIKNNSYVFFLKQWYEEYIDFLLTYHLNSMSSKLISMNKLG